MEKKKPNHKAGADCKSGSHDYMVTTWQIGGGKEKAVHVRCRRCLMHLNLEEVEIAERMSNEG